MKHAKKVWNTSIISNKDPTLQLHKHLKMYRVAPHPTTGKSPAELLFARKFRTKLPDIRTNPVMQDIQQARDQDRKESRDRIGSGRRRGRSQRGTGRRRGRPGTGRGQQGEMKFLATKNLDWEAQQATHTVSGSQETEGQREGTAHSREQETQDFTCTE